jgi:preprotein translocase subunit SecY
MNLDKLNSIVTRLFFVGAFFLAFIAVLERVVNLFGYTVLSVYTPGRLLEFAIVLLTFVIALLLRQVRDQLRHS